MINIKFKTEICRYFQANGTCPLGEKCHFAHGEDDLRKISDQLPENAPVLKHPKSHLYQQAMESGFNVNYKTVKCRFWDSGGCRFGAKCNFAHGDQELRAPQQNLTSFQNMNNNVQNVHRQLYNQAAQSRPEFQIKHRQLTYLAERLKFYHKDEEEFTESFEKAKAYLDANNIQQAATELQNIVYAKDLTEEQKAEHTKIVAEAKNIAQNYLGNYGGDTGMDQMGGMNNMNPMGQTMGMGHMGGMNPMGQGMGMGHMGGMNPMGQGMGMNPMGGINPMNIQGQNPGFNMNKTGYGEDQFN